MSDRKVKSDQGRVQRQPPAHSGLVILARIIAKAILADTGKDDIGQIPEKRKFENLP